MDDVPMGLYVLTALRARELFKRDVHYIVRNGEVKIVSINTGRVMPTSRWMDDLHQVSSGQSSLVILATELLHYHPSAEHSSLHVPQAHHI